MTVWPIAHAAVGVVAILTFRSMDISSSSVLHGAVLPLTFWISVVYFLVVIAIFIGRVVGGGSSSADGAPVTAALSDMASSGGGSSDADSSDN
jgi:hypothetical protein